MFRLNFQLFCIHFSNISVSSFRFIGLDIKLFGVVYFVMLLIPAIIVSFSHKVEAFLGEKKTLLFIPLFTGLSFFGMGLSATLWGILFIILFQIASELQHPVIKTYLNKHIPSDKRATILSLRSFGANFFVVIFSLFFGWIADLYTFRVSLFALGIGLLLFLTIIVFLWFRKR